MKRLLRKIFPSWFPTTEYVASSAEGLPCMLKCVAIIDDKRYELAAQPLMLGYKPLVMAICETQELIQLLPESRGLQFEYINIITSEKVAELNLRVDKIIPVEDQFLVLLEGVSGRQNFETKLERLAFRINQRLTKKSASNVDLNDHEYEMLKIGYSVPRSIRGTMVCLSLDKGRNIFPTDLHGPIAKKHFVLSLRTEKRSCAQVAEQEKFDSFLLSPDGASDWYKMGKNHSSEYQPVPHSVDAGGRIGYTPGIPIHGVLFNELKPAGVLGDYGIHRIFLLEILSEQEGFGNPSDYLVHVHRSYANWHKRQGFPLKEITR